MHGYERGLLPSPLRRDFPAFGTGFRELKHRAAGPRSPRSSTNATGRSTGSTDSDGRGQRRPRQTEWRASLYEGSEAEVQGNPHHRERRMDRLTPSFLLLRPHGVRSCTAAAARPPILFVAGIECPAHVNCTRKPLYFDHLRTDPPGRFRRSRCRTGPLSTSGADLVARPHSGSPESASRRDGLLVHSLKLIDSDGPSSEDQADEGKPRRLDPQLVARRQSASCFAATRPTGAPSTSTRWERDGLPRLGSSPEDPGRRGRDQPRSIAEREADRVPAVEVRVGGGNGHLHDQARRHRPEAPSDRWYEPCLVAERREDRLRAPGSGLGQHDRDLHDERRWDGAGRLTSGEESISPDSYPDGTEIVCVRAIRVLLVTVGSRTVKTAATPSLMGFAFIANPAWWPRDQHSLEASCDSWHGCARASGEAWQTPSERQETGEGRRMNQADPGARASAPGAPGLVGTGRRAARDGATPLRPTAAFRGTPASTLILAARIPELLRPDRGRRDPGRDPAGPRRGSDDATLDRRVQARRGRHARPRGRDRRNDEKPRVDRQSPGPLRVEQEGPMVFEVETWRTLLSNDVEQEQQGSRAAEKASRESMSTG